MSAATHVAFVVSNQLEICRTRFETPQVLAGMLCLLLEGVGLIG